MCTGEMPKEPSPVERVTRIIPKGSERLPNGLVQFAEVEKQFEPKCVFGAVNWRCRMGCGVDPSNR
jgi:hypothetical protein